MIKRIYICDRCREEITGNARCLSVYSFCEDCWNSFREWVKGVAVKGVARGVADLPEPACGGVAREGVRETLSVHDWADRFGVGPQAVYKAFRRMGLDPVPADDPRYPSHAGLAGRQSRLYELSEDTADSLGRRLVRNRRRGNPAFRRRMAK